jgi:hypothetical protein
LKTTVDLARAALIQSTLAAVPTDDKQQGRALREDDQGEEQ